jgi:hypothetical protein
MSLALAVVSAAAALTPQLPERGLALETKMRLLLRTPRSAQYLMWGG